MSKTATQYDIMTYQSNYSDKCPFSPVSMRYLTSHRKIVYSLQCIYP